MATTPTLPLGPYVYALADAGEVFYVGKGRHRRMFSHAACAERGAVGAKADRIRAILARGDQIEYRILGEYETDAQAYEAEKHFITSMRDGLTNIASGGGGVRLEPRERMKLQARTFLDRLMPFEQWAKTITPRLAETIRFLGESPESLYQRILTMLTLESESPTPNVYTFRPNLKVETGWV